MRKDLNIQVKYSNIFINLNFFAHEIKKQD
jgi:hypothetical protein